MENNSCFLTGSFGMVRDDIKYRNGKPENQGYVPSVMFLLETCGHLVVVDTGFGDPSVCAEKLQLSVKRSQSLEDIFKEASVKPKEVEAVIFTHLHWDHAGNAECFTNAQYYCHEKEWNRAENHPEEYPEEWFSWLKKNRDRVHFNSRGKCTGNNSGNLYTIYRWAYIWLSDGDC